MEKISYNGEEGYFLKEEEKKSLYEMMESFKDYRETTESLFKEVKV